MDYNSQLPQQKKLKDEARRWMRMQSQFLPFRTFQSINQTFGFLRFLTRYQENTNIQFFLLKGRERAEDLREPS